MGLRNPDDVEAALDLSLEHWTDLESRRMISIDDISENECVLCRLFLEPPVMPKTCGGCPIEVYSGAYGCKNTPWESVFTYLDINEGEADMYDPSIKLRVKKEREFIIDVKEWFKSIRHVW